MWERALGTLERAAKVGPEEPRVWEELGYVHYGMHQFEEAIEAYKTSLSLDGRNADTLTQLGLSYLGLGDVDACLGELEHAMAADPKHAKSRFNAAVVLLFEKRDADGAERLLGEAEALSPNHPDVPVLRAKIEELREKGQVSP
jgi:tetratricopeptide (TPR) repeat protein